MSSSNLLYLLIVQDVHVSNFTVSPPDGGPDLFKNADLVLVDGRRYGFVGKNGSGTHIFGLKLGTFHHSFIINCFYEFLSIMLQVKVPC